jgi:hypothetical protein
MSLLTLTIAGCFGNFALTRKLYEFNDGLAGDDFAGKFIKSVVFWALQIVPVYGICGLVDLWILNLIEFWTGANPIAMMPGEMDIRYAEADGKTYEIVTTKNRYDISEVDNPNNTIALVFCEDISAWYLHSNGEIVKITEENEAETKFFGLDGSLVAITVN